jgi:hypothetical protein
MSLANYNRLNNMYMEEGAYGEYADGRYTQNNQLRRRERHEQGIAYR